jgi:hypothetical protein
MYSRDYIGIYHQTIHTWISSADLSVVRFEWEWPSQYSPPDSLRAYDIWGFLFLSDATASIKSWCFLFSPE